MTQSLPGLNSYTKSEREHQFNAAQAQGAADKGVDISMMQNPADIADSRRVADNQILQDNGVRQHPMYSDISGYTQQEVDRYRNMGEAAANRQAYQQNFQDYNSGISNGRGSRREQEYGLGLDRRAAEGRAPSQAQILGQNMMQQGLDQQMSAAASARGGALGQAAAMRQAATNGAAYQQNATQQAMGMRAQEMAQARGAYDQAATQMRQGDYAQAAFGLQRTGMETQNEQFQRGLNQGAQSGYEGMAANVMSQQLQADMGVTQLNQQQSQFDQGRSDAMTSAAIGGASAAGGALIGLSDDRAKQDVIPLYEPPGRELHQGDNGLAFYATPPATGTGGASLDGPVPRYSVGQVAAMDNAPAAPAKEKHVSYEELSRQADELKRKMREEHEARMAQGPAVRADESPMSDANRAQAGIAYSYKPGLAPPGQEPGETNVGPRAQAMLTNPLTATAVKQDPSTGLLGLDQEKLTKLHSASIADLQGQIDSLKKKGPTRTAVSFGQALAGAAGKFAGGLAGNRPVSLGEIAGTRGYGWGGA